MDRSAHDAAIKEFCLYPEAGQATPLALSYVALGLCGETSELAIATRERNGNELSELGDVCWYLSRVRDEALFDDPLPGIPEPHTDRCVTPGQESAIRISAEMSLIAGQVAECVKKMVRDPDDIDELRGRLSKAVHLLEATAKDYALAKFGPGGLERARQANVDKLSGRAGRGTLHGSGEDR